MNRRSLVLFLSLLCTNAWGEEPSGAVFARKPIVNLVRPFRLPDVCRTSARVEACTAFVGQVLTCICEPADGVWHITAHAQFIPVLYVTNGDHLAHEREHIHDIEEAARAYVLGLASRTFDSERTCRAATAYETARFPRLMDLFKDDSNARRHRRYRRAFPARSLSEAGDQISVAKKACANDQERLSPVRECEARHPLVGEGGHAAWR